MFVITGGGSGIGQSLAWFLAKRNQSVLVLGRRESLLKETAAASPKIQYFCVDVATDAGMDALKNHLHALPQIRGLVNNAGTLDPLRPLTEITAKAWRHALNTNLNPALFLPQKLADKLTHGRVLNISSKAAHFPIKGWAAYCVTKAALSMLTQCWQLESSDIAVASVMPGIVDTPMQAIARSELNPDDSRVGFYKKLYDENRLLSPDTVAAFLTWLLLDVTKEAYVAQEWDIYDQSHHQAWLRPPHQVLHWDA